MNKPERSTYSPLDFREWYQTGGLVLSPKFQRRGVWTTPARSYLIDTLLLGMPVPPIYLRVVQGKGKDRMIREVIDGQQRISAVLDYMEGKYTLIKNMSSEASGKRFEELTEAQQAQIKQYPFICEVFYGIEDSQVLQIFARLNTHSVKLNAQELRHGRFFGPFKRTAYELALEHLEFWRRNRIFTELKIARMQEVELTSELMILQLDGLQDKKKSIDEFYAKYDGEFPKQNIVEKRFRKTIDEISEACANTLGQLEFRRPPLFYTLFGAVYHRLFGVPNERIKRTKTSQMSVVEREGLNTAVGKLSDLVGLAKSEEAVPASYERFVRACLRQTDNIRPRRTRLEFVYKEAFRD